MPSLVQDISSFQLNRAALAPALVDMLSRLARERPGAPFLRDDPALAASCGRPSRSHDRTSALATVALLSASLRNLGLSDGAAVAICLQSGPECCLSILAVMAAALTPLLVPVTLSEGATATALETGDAQAVITQSRIGDLSPAATFCALAARMFRLRFVLAIGPDVPDGVVDLDEILSGGSARSCDIKDLAGSAGGVVTVDNGTSNNRLLWRSTASLLAATAIVLTETRVHDGDLVLNFLAQDDLKGLCTGLLPCLISGATLGSALFDPIHVAAVLETIRHVHLVLPGWAERIMHGFRIEDAATSITYVHTAMRDLATHRPPLGSARIIDVLSFGETALVAAQRHPDGSCAISPDTLPMRRLPHDLLRFRLSDAGALDVCGPAASVSRLRMNGERSEIAATDWQPCLDGCGEAVSEP